jgi:glyoxylase-like metal-dependent hydrolase (beta-lactamase superfamily II)
MIRQYKLSTAIFLWIFVFLSLMFTQSHAQDAATRSIKHIKGDLYLYRNIDNFYSFIMETPEGIIVIDPVNADAAQWLKTEIKSRFSKPVRYVIYSHDHFDHTSGGEVFADTATFIAHRKAKDKIASSGHTPVPDITFSGIMDLELGGKHIELIEIGSSHSDNLIVARFPEERVLFTTDILAVKGLPHMALDDDYFPEVLYAMDVIDHLDYDIFVLGHGAIGTKADAIEHHTYMTALYDAVKSAIDEGLTLKQAQQRIKLDPYRHWNHYDEWLPLNIQGVYRILGVPID